jgi:serine/threonine-protein kinase
MDEAEGGELRPGDSLGPYRLERVLGEGAVGIVFLARKDPEDEPIALKVRKRRLSENQVFTRRFVHEARAAREVENNHLVPIVDAGEADGRHFVAMRFVQGRSLEERIRDEGPLPLGGVARLAAEVASGLDALHRAGLVHRDVKSSNILLDEHGTALLTDFGLAKGPAYTVLTRPGQVMGTLDYLAPELIRGEPAGAASDIYALGCVIYECVAGQPPFASKSLLELGAAHLDEEPPDPCAGRDGLPSELSWAVLRALEKEPAKRPPTATAYAHLVRASAGLGLR